MSKFGNLGASGVDQPFRVTIISPETDLPIEDTNKLAAYIEVLSGDSKKAREYDKLRRVAATRKLVAGRSEELIADDDLSAGIARLAHLTTGWHLVDPVTQEKIDVPCNESNAVELYSAGETAYIYRQASLGSNSLRNFTKNSSKSSGALASQNSGKTEK